MRKIYLLLFLLCSLSSLAKVSLDQRHVVYIYEDYSLKIEGDKVFIIRKTYSDRDKICLSKCKKQLLPFSSRGAHMIGTHDTPTLLPMSSIIIRFIGVGTTRLQLYPFSLRLWLQITLARIVLTSKVSGIM